MKGDYNHMEMTRILRSIMFLGQKELAHSSHECLLAAARAETTGISRRILAFWEKIM
jgi:hypothetical protein